MTPAERKRLENAKRELNKIRKNRGAAIQKKMLEGYGQFMAANSVFKRESFLEATIARLEKIDK